MERFNWPRTADWLATHASIVLAVFIALFVAHIILRRAVPAAIRHGLSRGGLLTDEARQRAETLTLVATRTAWVAIVIFAVLTALPEFGVSIAPILTGVGITGIAIGLGAQSLVRDTVNGVFILAENQYAYGDTVTVAGIFGTVEDVNLRRTVVRDLDGTLHSIPNGAIVVTSNHSRDFARARVQLVLAHGQDLGRVREAIDAAGRRLAAELGAAVLEAPRFIRVETVDATGVTVEVAAVTAPGRRWEVAGELRGRLPAALEEAGIRLAYGSQGVTE